MDKLDCFRHLIMDLCSNERMEAELKHRLGECMNIAGALRNIWMKGKVVKE